jgi:hypothetical protein
MNVARVEGLRRNSYTPDERLLMVALLPELLEGCWVVELDHSD